jgi:HEAT repeat protein
MSVYSLSKTLDFLYNEGAALSEQDLSALSDLGQEEIIQFQQTWEQLKPERREYLIKLLGESAEEKIEFNFEGINRFALSDPVPAIRKKAIENLWECDEQELSRTFVDSLQNDPDPGVRTAAAAALGKFVFFGQLERISPELLNICEEALLNSAKDDPHPGVRDRALESLGYSSRRDVVFLIEEAYDSELDETRTAALIAMSRTADPSWREHILSETQNSNPEIRCAAAKAIGELEIQQGLDDLLDLLGDENYEVLRATIWALSQLGGEEAREAISTILEFAEDELEIEYLEDALDNLVFVDSTKDILDFDEAEDTMA